MRAVATAAARFFNRKRFTDAIALPTTVKNFARGGLKLRPTA
jgi:hypothetical protein